MEPAEKEALLYTVGTPEFADLGIMSLNRPQVHNAFSGEMLTRMCEVLESAAVDPKVRALLLKSEGKSFCAGADLTWMQKTIQYTEKENIKDGQVLAKAFRLLNAFPKPVVIQVQGPAFGGGVGLMACGDYVLSLKKAFFSLSEVRLGLIPAVISPFVISKMGESAARALFITGKRFMADEALHYGLIHEIMETPEELESATQKILKAIWEGGPVAQQEAKKLIFDVTAQLSVCPLSENELLHTHTAKTIARLRVGAEAQEGMQALLEKRAPAFKSKPTNKLKS